MPLPFLFVRLAGVFSLVVLISGLWFVADWTVQGGTQSVIWLAAGLLLLAFALFGRRLVLRGLPHSDAEAQPKPLDGQIDRVAGSAGAHLHVEVFGSRAAPPLILTHGPGLDRTIWRGLVPLLADRYQVIVWDQAGVGLSGRPFDGLYSIERLGEDLRAVLQVADRRPAFLVGHSGGALAALALCQAHPELTERAIAGLVLLNASSRPAVEAGRDRAFLRHARRPLLEPLLKLTAWMTPLAHLGAWASYLNGLSHLVARATAFGADPGREVLEQVTWLNVHNAPSVQARAVEAMLAWPGVATLPDLPMLAVGGDRDLLVEPEAVQETAAASSQGEYLLIPDVGHLGPVEAPTAYAAAIDGWARTVLERAGRLPKGLHADILRRRVDHFELKPAHAPDGEQPPIIPIPRRARRARPSA